MKGSLTLKIVGSIPQNAWSGLSGTLNMSNWSLAHITAYVEITALMWSRTIYAHQRHLVSIRLCQVGSVYLSMFTPTLNFCAIYLVNIWPRPEKPLRFISKEKNEKENNITLLYYYYWFVSSLNHMHVINNNFYSFL